MEKRLREEIQGEFKSSSLSGGGGGGGFLPEKRRQTLCRSTTNTPDATKCQQTSKKEINKSNTKQKLYIP